MSVISLTTDFGIQNEFVGVMKGVIYGIASDAKIIDVTHGISPQNIMEGAFALWRAYSFFPKGSVHVYVVDPGVGTTRRPIAARIGDFLFVGPDNGLLTPILGEAGLRQYPVEIVHLENPKYWLAKISRTFHGRDIFSPVAAHLFNGVPLHELGSVIHDPVSIAVPKPKRTSDGWEAHITVIDVFGNLTLDMPAALLEAGRKVSFHFHGAVIHGVAEAYGDRAPGELVAVIDSENFLELAVVNGSAAKRLDASQGDVVEVIFSV